MPIGRSAALPYTASHELVLASPTMVCLFDSYSSSLVCGDRLWERSHQAAEEGAGPGEIRSTWGLVGAPGGGFAQVDIVNGRINLFGSDGSFRSTRPLPAILNPIGDLGADSVLGGMSPPSPSEPSVELVWLSLRTTSVIHRLTLGLPRAALDGGYSRITGVRQLKDGRIVARLDSDRLAFFDAGGRFRKLGPRFEFPVSPPDERDVQRFVEALRPIFPQGPPEDDLRRFRERRPGRIRGGSARRVISADADGRVWVLTNRDSSDSTYFAVIDSTNNVEFIAVPGHVLNFAIHDSLLVAFVEADEADDYGLFPLFLDSYRLTPPSSVEH